MLQKTRMKIVARAIYINRIFSNTYFPLFCWKIKKCFNCCFLRWIRLRTKLFNDVYYQFIPVHKSKNRKTIILLKTLRSLNFALLFVLIQQNTATFFSYSIRNYNAMTSKIWTKDNLWQKILVEILKRFFVTVLI